MNPHATHHRYGFTLIELILSITIIIFLAGLVVGGFGFVKDKQAQKAAEVQVALLSRGVDEYHLDMGVYPGEGASSEFGGDATPVNGDNSEVLYQALFFEGWDYVNRNRPSIWESYKATTMYVPELDPIHSNQGWVKQTSGSTPLENQKIVDPWDNNYRYRVGDNASNPDFDLWSSGKDGRTSANPYNPNHVDNRDDIRNF